ncbi:MAG: hypothetical protein K1Y36_22240 [Blastocatellia bacterium]|nr:hypothetical protein [Blastocatellia bacterium]
MKNLKLVYQIVCDDVRLELGNKLSLMGIFHDFYVQQLPVTLPKLAILNHWTGSGTFLSEVRIMYPGKQKVLAASSPAPFEVPAGGYANNISFFINLTFDKPGEYTIQTLIDSSLFEERRLIVGVVQMDDEAVDEDFVQ